MRDSLGMLIVRPNPRQLGLAVPPWVGVMITSGRWDGNRRIWRPQPKTGRGESRLRSFGDMARYLPTAVHTS